jgi:hypothetical protein
VRKKFCIIILPVLLASFSASANVIYVDCAGPNDPGTGTFDDPFRRIRTGIDAAVEGDVVLINPGVYIGPGNYDLDPQGKSITISSIDPNDPDVITLTIIDPNQTGRGFCFQSGEDANCILSGLTIINARAIDGNNGAGIYCLDNSPTIRNCVIQNSYAEEGFGGGICLDEGSTAIITNCTITDNSAAYYGGGISCIYSSPVITGCTISGNTAILEGGGIDSGHSDANILNCVIIDNKAPLGGGINCFAEGTTTVVNCTIVANSADEAGGAVHCWFQGSIIIENSILWANSATDGNQLGLTNEGTVSVSYCDVQGGRGGVYDPCNGLDWGQANINIDPCFASFDPNGNPNLWDFHLQSIDGRWDPARFPAADMTQNGFVDLKDFTVLAAVWLQQGENLAGDLDYSGAVNLLDLRIMLNSYLTTQSKGTWMRDTVSSPCLDGGDPNSDWTNEPWPNGKRVNMGAYGGTNQASKNGNPADFDVNGVVNLLDFMEFGSKWLDEQGGIANLDLAGQVDFHDFAMFARNWLWEKQ